VELSRSRVTLAAIWRGCPAGRWGVWLRALEAKTQSGFPVHERARRTVTTARIVRNLYDTQETFARGDAQEDIDIKIRRTMWNRRLDELLVFRAELVRQEHWPEHPRRGGPNRQSQ